MALYTFDGTGNEDHEGDLRDSNALKFHFAYDDAEKNNDPALKRGSLYLKGIGTLAHTGVGKVVSEALGIGGFHRVDQAIGRLRANLTAGDSKIDIVGFSRGAALALSFANTIADKFPGIPVRYVGLFDTVGEFGLPGRFVNAGHDLRMPKNAEHVYHAMAMDETRAFFPLTRLGDGKHQDPRLQEVWFRGVHSDIGGGNNNPGLNWIALNWLFQAARRHDVPVGATAIAANLAGKALAMAISDHDVDAQVPRHFRSTDLIHCTVVFDEGVAGRPHNNPRHACARIDDAGLITPAAV